VKSIELIPLIFIGAGEGIIQMG